MSNTHSHTNLHSPRPHSRERNIIWISLSGPSIFLIILRYKKTGECQSQDNYLVEKGKKDDKFFILVPICGTEVKFADGNAWCLGLMGEGIAFAMKNTKQS